ncbi:MAG: glycosyl hydrolase family 65 protein [Candidatus Omnitrophica bacterium]|nr:glycosyl hydrolase family 65 protein [Candidatus Omnitrophota bacterium]
MEKIVQPYPWRLVYGRFEPAQESLREVLCTLGNGYFGTRGAALESTESKIHYPATYMAGLYNKLATNISGRTVYNDDLVNCPNWTFLTFKIGDGNWFSPSVSRLISFRQELNMKEGVLLRKIRFQDYYGRKTLVETRMIVHMANYHIAAIEYSITPENYSEIVTFRTMLDGSVENTGVERYRQLNSKHLRAESIGRLSSNGVFLSVKTNQSRIQIVVAEKVNLFVKDKEVKMRIRPITRRLLKGQERIGQEFKIMANKGQTYRVEKIVALSNSRDSKIESPLTTSVEELKKARSFKELLKTHQRVMAELWDKSDIIVEGDTFAQMVLRLHVFHLLQTASIHNVNIDAGIPARGLHGEAYRGHVFWDEIFLMPFFETHLPQVSKSSLLYRYRRLNRARQYARDNGYSGAMFPWQSSLTGEEETQEVHLNPLSGKWGPDYSRKQRHVSFAIAYNLWHYWKVTDDLGFLGRFGAELFLSIAQFGASLAKYNFLDRRYHVKGIMGPDEFHEKMPGAKQGGIKDNAYTNIMIVWTLIKAQEILDLLSFSDKRRIMSKLGISEKDLRSWQNITKSMSITIENNIISQFDGYFQLKELDWKAYRSEYGNIKRMDRILKAEGKSPDDYKVSKQADVLMLFFLFSEQELKAIFDRLGYRYDADILKRHYDYYEKRTSHGSTLSKVVHCCLSHKLGRQKDSWDWFCEVLKSDIYDTQGGTTPEGIHAGVMGGSLDIVYRRFAGIEVGHNILRINPSLPRQWKSLRLRFCYRNYWVCLLVTKYQLTVTIEGSSGLDFVVPVEIKGRRYSFSLGRSYKLMLEKA